MKSVFSFQYLVRITGDKFFLFIYLLIRFFGKIFK
jgi:hypothetical protein